MTRVAEAFLNAANVARLVGENALADALMTVALRHADESHDIDTRHALPDACEVDEPTVGARLTGRRKSEE